MAKELLYYDIFPRIVRAGSEQIITIRPLYEHVRFSAQQTYTAALIPMEGLDGQMRWSAPDGLPLKPQGGVLQVPCRFAGEQEYVLRIAAEDGPPVEFHLFALADDLYQRRPYKGDFHLHTFRSDGKESPAYVAAACRKIGLDFMAITDHHQYAPSLEAIQAFHGVQTDLRLYPGEEVHPPDTCVHILHFGGRFSINDLFDSQAYRDGVQAIAESLADFPPGVDRLPYAACVWSYDKIREAGGLGVFCHPYWISRQRYDVPLALTNLLLDRQPFDALELIGGYHRFELESNTLQVARYQEERARGKRIPIVGVSDSHGCETGDLFGWFYTIVFSPSADLPDLIHNIKDLYSVAVEACP